MALWEYKVITSGLHGFASPALLEAHLNALGKDEWEILHFQTLPNNPLAFNGLARRGTQRDWTPPIEAVVAAPVKSAYEPAVTQNKSAASATPAAKADQEAVTGRTEEKLEPADPSREDSLRPMRNTERDLDLDAEEEEDDWNSWEDEQDALPTLFEALKPHFRRNQKGVGMSVAIDYLAKRWEQREADLIGALKECGFTVPESEEADPDYFEFEGDLYWVNCNNRGQFFINTREKPRPAFRVAPVKKLDPADPAAVELAAERAAERAELEKRKAERLERAERQAAAQAAAAAAREKGPAIDDQEEFSPAAAENNKADPDAAVVPLPIGPELLDKIRPLMRRNRRGPGYSGSVGFLARALKAPEAELVAALTAIGLTAPENAADKPVYVEITDGVYWMNKDSRGGVWINGREKRDREVKSADKTESPDTATPTDAAAAADRIAEIAPGSQAISSTPTNDGSEAAAPATQPGSHAMDPVPSEVASVPSSGETVERKSDFEAGAEEENARSGKPAKARKPSTRPRTRKAKASVTDALADENGEKKSAEGDESSKEE